MAKRSGSVWLISFAVSMTCLAWAGQASAGAQDLKKLSGDYAFSGEAFCIQSTSGFDSTLGFSPNPNGTVTFRPFNVQGIRTFNGDGSGTVVFTQVGINIPGDGGNQNQNLKPNANAGEGHANFTYTVAPDGSFTVDQGPITVTTVAGAGNGNIGVTTGVKFSGQASKDWNTLVLSTDGLNVETTTTSGGVFLRDQICTRARTAVKIK